jgi:hypothetical protein
VSEAEQARMVKAAERAIVEYEKDPVSKGFKAAEVMAG